MALLDLPRVPEPEVMEDSAEVEAYASAAAQAHLDSIDDTFVEHAVALVAGKESGYALDIGTGPGQIVIKLARRLTLWKFAAVDRSGAMIAQANLNLAASGSTLSGHVAFHVADANSLKFPDHTFDFVMCNSVLHHLAEPQKLFAEIARLATPGAAILLRDLRRPSRLLYPFHVWRHGRHYSGTMRKLFYDSVRSAYTTEELQKMLNASPLRAAHIFEHRSTHIGIERADSQGLSRSFSR
jgi:ubiquinone/menaquinone biosynthesis C-methylase UbiE